MIFILDAAALLNNEAFSFVRGKNSYYTTSLVFSEWRDFRSRLLAQNALATGSLVIQDPCPLSIEKSYAKASESGTVLGDADISLVALCSEFMARKEKFRVVTDDYSVQNVLKKMKIRFEGVAQRGIKKHLKFSRKGFIFRG